MDRRDTFYRQKLTDTEMDELFDLAENADRAISLDNSLTGVHSGEVVSQATVPDLTVQVSAGVATDKLGRRLLIPGPQSPNCAVDENALTTAVTTPGNQKFLSVFLRFTRAESDPRTDGNGDTIQYVQDESFAIRVVQGVEALPDAPRPALDPEDILLADIRLAFGQTQIFDADILVDRREDLIRFDGTNLDVIAGTVAGAIQSDIIPALDDHEGRILALESDAIQPRFIAMEGRVRALAGTVAYSSSGTLLSTAALQASMAIDMVPSETLDQIRFRVRPNGTDFWTCEVAKFDVDSSFTLLGSANSTTGSSWEWVTVGSLAAPVTTGDRFAVRVTTSNGAASAMEVSGIEITVT